MSPRITLSVALRVLRQLRHDPRTIAMLVVVPCVLLTLLWWMFDGDDLVFNQFGPPLLAMFPFIVMFLVTSVTTLRERPGLLFRQAARGRRGARILEVSQAALAPPTQSRFPPTMV